MFLRANLKNYQIDFLPVIISREKEIKPYTPVEKFTKMAEINPAIRLLKEKLDLDIDY